MEPLDVLERFLDLLSEEGHGLGPEEHTALSRLMRHQLKNGPFSRRSIPRIVGPTWTQVWPKIRDRYPIRKSDGLLSFRQINRWRSDIAGGTEEQQAAAREVFEAWWSTYPEQMRKGGKKRCQRIFVRMFLQGKLPEDPVAELVSRITFDHLWLKGIGIPYPERYLRNELFSDVVSAAPSANQDSAAESAAFEAMRATGVN